MTNFFRAIANEVERVGKRVEAEAGRVNERYLGGGKHIDFEEMKREIQNKMMQHVLQLECRNVPNNNEEDHGYPEIPSVAESNRSNDNNENEI